ncbi:MAG TPA: SMP-30/gluconolactonase/LRE family protein, partial [Steroidobacteraceae bacterium]|nr:SMP-30/gluconolactonase/LRE family protein [Steroidobacteraceae bacterium]
MSYQTHIFCGVEPWARRLLVAFLVFLSLTGWIRVSCAAGTKALAQGRGYTEGTIFVGGVLYFVDFSSSDVSRVGTRTVESVWHQDGCGPSGLLQVKQGIFVACYSGNTLVLISLNGQVLQTIREDDSGRPFDGPNDLAADAEGGFYFSASGSDKILGKSTTARPAVSSDRWLRISTTLTGSLYRPMGNCCMSRKASH